MKTEIAVIEEYHATGTFPVAWTCACPHHAPQERIVPPASAPDWVHRLVCPAVNNSDNGLGAGIMVGTYWTVNGWVVTWTPTIFSGRIVKKIEVTITPSRSPKFPLPRVGHIPGYGLGVIGPETTSSEGGVPAEFTVKMW